MKKLSMFGIMLISMLGLVSYVSAQETAVTTSMLITEEPTICTMQYDPVCGEDGTTYGNSCMAQSVKIAYTGECKEEVVDEPAPIACTREYMPVCANVQVQCITAPCFPVQETFANACTAKAAGAEVIFEGDCNIAQGGVTDPTASDIVTWAHDLGITKYTNTAQFMYDAPVTREQAAKMIMTAIDASGVEQWMVKQQDGSCEWSDSSDIDASLSEMVSMSCFKGLFHGSNGNFMPRAYLTDTDARTVMYRVAQYVPALADHLALVRLAATNDVALTRGEFVSWLHNIYEQITAESIIEPAPENTTTIDTVQAQAELDAAIILWDSHNMSDYRLIQQRTCFCMVDYTRPVIYNVVANMVDTGSIRYYSDGGVYALEDKRMTIDQAFAMIQDVIDQKVASMIVVYDAVYGYPTTISIDYNEMMADEEVYLSFTLVDDMAIDLSGSYILDNINYETMSNTGITLDITSDRISVKMCNNLNVSYTATNESIVAGPMMSTMMYCDDAQLMDLEQQFSQIENISYTMTDSTLMMYINDDTWVWSKQ